MFRGGFIYLFIIIFFFWGGAGGRVGGYPIGGWSPGLPFLQAEDYESMTKQNKLTKVLRQHLPCLHTLCVCVILLYMRQTLTPRRT